MIVLTGNNAYALKHEHKNGWNADAFKERYSEVLERYDYIVGDWGYNQLRLRGFYRDGHPKATKETMIASLVDYLNEYCNFGCAYFVLQKTDLKAATSGELQAGDGDIVAVGTAAEASETAATAPATPPGGMITRWPLKERAGGPVRMPGAAAVARAAEEAERRGLHAQSQAGGGPAADNRSGQNGSRSSADSSYENKGANRNAADIARRPSRGSSSAQAEHNRSGGRQHSSGRSSRSSHHDRQGGRHAGKTGNGWRQAEAERNQETPHAAQSVDQKAETTRNGPRWAGKTRKKNRFGPKPNRSDSSFKGGGTPGRSSGD